MSVHLGQPRPASALARHRASAGNLALAIAASAVAAVISQHALHTFASAARMAWGWLAHVRQGSGPA